MKNVLKTLPIMLFPYIYMLCAAGCYAAFANSPDTGRALRISFIITLVIAISCTVYAFVISALLLHSAAKGRTDAKTLAKLNMTIKLVQIPAYLIHFCMGMIGLMMSIWGIPVILWAILIDLITIVMSGIVSIGANVSGKKENVLSTAQAVTFSILGFVYCADVVVSIVLFAIVKRKNKRKTQPLPAC